MKRLIILKEAVGRVKSAEDIFKSIKKINIDYDQENFIIFYLDANHKIIDSEVLFKGGSNSCLICPRTLFRKALLNKSETLIVAHNHPSGDLTPSSEDKEIFKMLVQAGEMIDIQVLDKVIFNEKEFYSMGGED